MADKAEKHRLAVKKYRESLGIDKVRELTREYTKNKRENLEYKNQEKVLKGFIFVLWVMGYLLYTLPCGAAPLAGVFK